MEKITVETQNGPVDIDTAVLSGYLEEAFQYLSKESHAKTGFKDAMEAQAEGLGLSNALWTKYVKASFKDSTKDAKDLGDLFTALDEAVG